MIKLKVKKFNSIYHCITPIYYFSKIFSLAPFTLKPKDGKFNSSYWDYLIFLLLESLLIYLFQSNIRSIYLITPTDSYIFNMCERVSLFWMHFIAILSIFIIMFFRRKFYKILKLLSDCDEKLLSIGAVVKFTKHFRFTLLYVIFTGIVNVMAQFSTIIKLYNVLDTTVDRNVFLANFLNHVIHWIVVSQYFLLIIALKTRFKTLNKIFR